MSVFYDTANNHRLEMIERRHDGAYLYQDIDDNSRVICRAGDVSLYPQPIRRAHNGKAILRSCPPAKTTSNGAGSGSEPRAALCFDKELEIGGVRIKGCREGTGRSAAGHRWNAEGAEVKQ